jgi:hypothetical protein
MTDGNKLTGNLPSELPSELDDLSGTLTFCSLCKIHASGCSLIVMFHFGNHRLTPLLFLSMCAYFTDGQDSGVPLTDTFGVKGSCSLVE